MQRNELDGETYERIKELCARGDRSVELKQFETAFHFYRDALNLVPEPVEDWEATTWILAAIGDLHWHEGKIDKSLSAFEDAVRCPGGLGNPFIHLRLGQCSFELGELDRSADELARTYMATGLEILEQEDPKYLAFLRTRMKIDDRG